MLGGVGMESLIFAGIALLIMIPIIYFLPLGFSTQGRVVIIGTALSISLIGLLTTSLMSIGQALLIVILLIVSVGYFLTKKIDMFLLPINGEELEIVTDSEDSLNSNTFTDSFSHIALSDKGMKGTGDDESEQVLNNGLKQVGASALNILLENRDKLESELETPDYSEIGGISEIELVPRRNANEPMDNLFLETKKGIEGENEQEEIFESYEDDLEVPLNDELSNTDLEKEEQVIEERDLENLVEDTDELPEIIFETHDQELNNPKDKENDLDEHFWNNLLEEDDDELDVIEEKKETPITK